MKLPGRILLAAATLLAASSALAADGTWTNTASGGLWSATGNWSGATVADGSGFTANFNTLNTAVDNTVHLDGSHTLTALIFGDTATATPFNWTLDNNGVAGNILTLAGATPTITVNDLGTGKTATISAVISGSAGLTKAGAGTLVLSGANNYTTGTIVSAGTLQANTVASLQGAVSVGATGTLVLNDSGIPGWSNAITGAGLVKIMTNGSGDTQVSGFASGFTGTIEIANTGTNGNKWATTATGTGANTANADLIIDNNSQLYASGSSTFKSLSIVGTGNTEIRGAIRFSLGTLTFTNGTSLKGDTTIGLDYGTSTLNSAISTGVAGTSTLTFGATNALTGDLTINGVLSNGTGTLAVTKVGSGILTLASNNTYTGATTVQSGRLNLSGTNTSAITVGNGATLGSSSTASTTGLLTLNTGATLAITGGATLAGFTSNGFTLGGASTVAFGTAAANGNVYNVVTYGAGAFTGSLANLSASNAHGLFANTGTAITYTGAGAQTDTWNTTTGVWETTTANWTNAIGDSKFIGGDNVLFGNPASASTITLNGTLTPASVSVNSTNNYTFNNGTGSISGSGSLTKAGTGTLTLSGQQSYTGSTTVNGGILDLTGGGGASGAIRGTVTVNTGGTLRISTGDATGYGGGASSLTLINLVGGTLNVAVAGSGNNQTLGSAVINLTGGSITGIANSNLDFFGGGSALNSLASSTTSTITGTKLTLRQTGGVTFTVASGTTASGIDLDIASVVTNDTYGAQAFTKAGTGAIRLTGANNYTGATAINAGKIITGSTTALGNTTGVTVANNATLQVGDGTANKTVTLASGSTLAIANGATLKLGAFNTLSLDAAAGTNGIVALSGTGGFNFNTTGTIDLNGMLNGLSDGAHTYNLITGGTGAKTDSVTLTGFNSTVTGLSMTGGKLSFTTVPEPSTYGLLGAGALAAVAFVSRRRRNKN